MKTAMTLEQRLQKANFKVIDHIKYCAIGGVVMYGKQTVVDDPITAYTDGRDVVYGRKHLEELNDAQLRHLILHENYHKAFCHSTVWRHLFLEDPQLMGRAADHVVDLALEDLDAGEGFIQFHPMWQPPDPRFRGMDTGQVYRILKQEQQKQQKEGEGKGVKANGGKGGKANGGKGGQISDEHRWESAANMTEAEQKKVQADIDQALRQGAILAGKRKGQMDRALGELLEPKINWREALREFVMSITAGKDQSTWRTVNRRFISQSLYMPGSYSETVGRVLVGVDTSGSIGGPDLVAFLAEIKSICETVKPEAVDLLYWDHVVQAHEKYGVHELDQLVTSTKPTGGGGTTTSCVTSHMRESQIKAECAIVFTDGHVGGDWGGDWPCPVMFVIAGGNKVVAPVGKTIHLD